MEDSAAKPLSSESGVKSVPIAPGGIPRSFSCVFAGDGRPPPSMAAAVPPAQIHHRLLGYALSAWPPSGSFSLSSPSARSGTGPRLKRLAGRFAPTVRSVALDLGNRCRVSLRRRLPARRSWIRPRALHKARRYRIPQKRPSSYHFGRRRLPAGGAHGRNLRRGDLSRISPTPVHWLDSAMPPAGIVFAGGTFRRGARLPGSEREH